MARYSRRLTIITGLLTFTGLAACSIASPTYVTAREAEATEAEEGADSKPQSGPPAPGTNDTCDAAFVKVDVKTLTACEGGRGHCYAKEKVGEFAAQLIPCANANEVCVPNEVLAAGGEMLKTCKSVIGAGACFTASLVPEIGKRAAGALKQDVCEPHQLCLPCADPTNNNAPTPFCQPIGVRDRACSAGGGASTPPPGPPPVACCTTNGVSNGVCIAETAVPEDQRSDVKQDVCPAANKCVPKALVEGKPVTCDSGIGGSGVCMDKCFNEMLGFVADIGFLSSEGCGATEVCVPCSLASGQNIPGCS
jgi:hypothetical protein